MGATAVSPRSSTRPGLGFLDTVPVRVTLAFSRSSIGRKWIVGLTGLVLLGFVAGHLIGNLQVFWGPDQINSYAVHLQELGPLLWAVRLVLLTCFVLHVWTSIALARANRAARPVKYQYYQTAQASRASRTMVVSGLIVLSFVVFHLLHFTFGLVDSSHTHLHEHLRLHEPGADPLRHDVYRMIVGGFQHVSISFFYLLGIGLLCWHLSHGFASVFQTLGLRSQKVTKLLTQLSYAVALLLFLGYCSIPLAVLLGIVTDTRYPF